MYTETNPATEFSAYKLLIRLSAADRAIGVNKALGHLPDNCAPLCSSKEKKMPSLSKVALRVCAYNCVNTPFSDFGPAELMAWEKNAFHHLLSWVGARSLFMLKRIYNCSCSKWNWGSFVLWVLLPPCFVTQARC